MLPNLSKPSFEVRIVEILHEAFEVLEFPINSQFSLELSPRKPEIAFSTA